MSVAQAPLDRRQRRRQETIEEVLDVAVDLMAEQGVAGLSLGELARRMGIRPPSLYVYFESKNAVYDALFARGARSVLAAMEEAFAADAQKASPLQEILLEVANVFVRWALENPVYSQLLFWRPVPGFVPSADAYAPAVELFDMGTKRIATLQEHGQVRSDVAAEQIQRDWAILISGVVSQQLSNAPDEGFDEGRFVEALPELVAMFVRHYGVAKPPTERRRASRAHQR